MAFVTPSEDIIVSEGTMAFTYQASGAISGAMLVKMQGDDKVVKCAGSTDNAIGVAAYTVANGEQVAVWGPGNLVRTYTASANVRAGDDVFVGNNAGVNKDLTLGGTDVCVGVCTEGTVAAGTVKVLLK